MNDLTTKKIKQFRDHFPDSGYMEIWGYSMESFIEDAMKEAQQQTARDICAWTDEIELKQYGNAPIEVWKLFKHIRNRIRDRYELSQEK